MGAILGMLACVFGSGCAGKDLPLEAVAPQMLLDLDRIADLRVTLGGDLSDSDRKTLELVDVPMLIRLAALDWFDHDGRFDIEGQISFEVEVLALALAGAIPVWLWRGWAGDDRLEVKVRVLDAGVFREDFSLTERTGVEGWEWRDADARLDRMARRLGRRIAEVL